MRTKLKHLSVLASDVYVIQECEDPGRAASPEYEDWAEHYVWQGKNKNRGIGVFSRSELSIKLDKSFAGRFSLDGVKNRHGAVSWTSDELELFLPIEISNGTKLLGVWTKGRPDLEFSYIGQLWKYLQTVKSCLVSEHRIVCGDFNSNAIWDKVDRWWNHSDVVAELEELGIVSLYHSLLKEEQGKESKATFYRHRKLEKGYHIDHFFASMPMSKKAKLEVGSPDFWLQHSDHVPITVTF